MMKLSKSWAAAAAIVALTGPTQAALVDRAGGMIYDTTLNITWLADWNYAFSSGYAAANAGGSGTNQIQSNGYMGWDAAKNWANNLIYGGYDDWRLPTSLNTDGTGPCGPAYNCASSEMGHMFYNNWGATAGNNFTTGTNAASLALFSKVQTNAYWSGTEFAVHPGYAWYFGTNDGFQYLVDKNYGDKIGGLYAVAVRPGDVAASVPEPATLTLAAIALLGFAAARRRQPAASFA